MSAPQRHMATDDFVPGSDNGRADKHAHAHAKPDNQPLTSRRGNSVNPHLAREEPTDDAFMMMRFAQLHDKQRPWLGRHLIVPNRTTDGEQTLNEEDHALL